MWLPEVKDKWLHPELPKHEEGSMMSSRPLRILETYIPTGIYLGASRNGMKGCQLWAEKALQSYSLARFKGSRDFSWRKAGVYGKHRQEITTEALGFRVRPYHLQWRITYCMKIENSLFYEMMYERRSTQAWGQNLHVATTGTLELGFFQAHRVITWAGVQ